MMVEKAYTVYADSRRMSREEWLVKRREGIGGSDAGAIMGVSPYKGPFTVWSEKMGNADTLEDSEAMRQGRDLEDYVARRFAEKTGRKVLREYGMLRSKAHPCMVANIDRKVRGMKAGLECKTSKDLYMKRWRDDEMPMEYYCQCLHYMAVTGWRTWYLCVVIYGTAVKVYKISRGVGRREEGVDAYIDNVQDDMETLIGREEAFWAEYIEGHGVPPVDGLKTTSEALGRMYAESDGGAIDSDIDDECDIDEVIRLKDEKRSIEKRIREAENRLKAKMATAEELRSTAALVTWRPQKRRAISAAKIRELYPEVDIEKIKEETSTRRFSVRTEDEDE